MCLREVSQVLLRIVEPRPMDQPGIFTVLCSWMVFFLSRGKPAEVSQAICIQHLLEAMEIK